MKKIRYILLLATILILLVGVASASEVSEDKTDTGSITEEAVTQDTHKVSDTANNIQENKANENIQTNRSINKIDKNTIETKKAAKNTKKEEVITVNNWRELLNVIESSKYKQENFTVKLGKGTYTDNEAIYCNNNNKIVLTIDGNGQTINANQHQAFYVFNNASVVLKNITIINGYSDNIGGIIRNSANLTIINSTIAKSSAYSYGGAIWNQGGYVTIINSTLTNNYATLGGALYNDNGCLTIVNSTLTNNTAEAQGGAIWHKWGYLTITQSILTNNSAPMAGGAIYADGTFSITESTLINNSGAMGAAIDSYHQDYSISVIQTLQTIMDNVVVQYVH